MFAFALFALLSVPTPEPTVTITLVRWPFT
jgi:hypothetical protein